MNDEVNIVVSIAAGAFSWSNVVYTAGENTERCRIFTNHQQLKQIRPQHLRSH